MSAIITLVKLFKKYPDKMLQDNGHCYQEWCFFVSVLLFSDLNSYILMSSKILN